MSIRILQLTDLHLFENVENSLLGVNTYSTLQAVVAHIKNGYFQAKPDIVIISGDISQDCSIESYKLAKAVISDFDCPVFAIPGNHDEPELFRKILCTAKGVVCTEKKFICGGWKVILLNTQVSNEIFGFLSDGELDFFKKELDADPLTPTLIFLHHHVMPVGCAWLDKIGLRNAKMFLSKIGDGVYNIKAVVCGHVHQEFNMMVNGIRFLATPSTCFQFAANFPTFKLGTSRPGYRWFELHSDESYATEVVRIKLDDAFVPDINNRDGYYK